MDRDPRENDGRMVPDRGESGEPEGKADGEKSTEKWDASGFRKTVW